MSYQYYDAQGNNYVRPWNNDFTDAEKQELLIGEYRDPATYKMPTHYYNPVPMGREQHNSWPGNPEDILKRMQEQDHSWPWKDNHPLAPVGNPDRKVPLDGRLPNSWDPSRRFEDHDPRVPDMDYWGGVPEGPTTWPGGGVPRDLPYSEEETNQRKWGLLNSVVDAIKAGASGLGDFIYGGADINYTDANEQDRMRAAEEQRKREFAAELINRERDQSRELRQIDMMDRGPQGPRRAGYGLDMFGNPISRY